MKHIEAAGCDSCVKYIENILKHTHKKLNLGYVMSKIRHYLKDSTDNQINVRRPSKSKNKYQKSGVKSTAFEATTVSIK